jgi:hypothetical protein
MKNLILLAAFVVGFVAGLGTGYYMRGSNNENRFVHQGVGPREMFDQKTGKACSTDVPDDDSIFKDLRTVPPAPKTIYCSDLVR